MTSNKNLNNDKFCFTNEYLLHLKWPYRLMLIHVCIDILYDETFFPWPVSLELIKRADKKNDRFKRVELRDKN